MKIKITTEVAVAEDVRPEIGSVHEVIDVTEPPLKKMYRIRMGRAVIGVSPGECEVTEEEGQP